MLVLPSHGKITKRRNGDVLSAKAEIIAPRLTLLDRLT